MPRAFLMRASQCVKSEFEVVLRGVGVCRGV